MAILDHKLVLGGDFTTVNGKSRQHLAAVNAGTGHLSHWTASVDGSVLALLSMRGEVYVGGKFGRERRTRANLFALDDQAVLSSTWPDQAAGVTDHWVDTLAASADHHSVLVGGSFHTLAGSPRSFLGSIARGSGIVREWDPAPFCTGSASCTTGGGRQPRVRRGRRPWRRRGGLPGRHRCTVWAKHTSGNVNSIALAGKHLVIGGHFTRVHSTIARCSRSWSRAAGRSRPGPRRRPARPYPGVDVVDVHDGRIRLGGGFESIAGQRRYAVLPE